MADKLNKVHFPNLNGLRLFLALFIVIIHLEDIKFKIGRENIAATPIFTDHDILPQLAVTFFFVLSGFLISYLLMKEGQQTGSINLKDYYKRRVLRIWPLYYFIILVGFFVLPHLGTFFSYAHSESLYKHFWRKFVFALFFLPPVISGGITRLPYTLGPVWTIRVEEAFYLCWPLLVRKTKNYLKLFLWIIAGFIAIHAGLNVIEVFFKQSLSPLHLRVINALKSIFVTYRISCMAIGATGAYLVVFNKSKILSFIYRRDVRCVVYVITACMLLFNIYIPVIFFELYSVLFCFIIINMGTNPDTTLLLNYKWMDYLGKTSYGIYLYNSITRIMCVQFIEYVYGRQISGWQMQLVLYVCCVSSTLLIAVLSYEFFEKPFIRFKNKFEVVKTE